MKHTLYIIGITLLAMLTSCRSDEAPYPALLTEFVDLLYDTRTGRPLLVLGNGNRYPVTNKMNGLDPHTAYRAVCSFVIEEQVATIYTLESVHLLCDSTATVRHDPIRVRCAERRDRYINLQLEPQGQQIPHHWGYAVDSITPGHYHLSLHHNQNGDAPSYTRTTYASLPLDKLADIQPGDTVTLTIHTFKGKQQWTIVK